MDAKKEQKLYRLRQALAEIESRRQKLLREIIQLESNTTDVSENGFQATLNNASPTGDKIGLFRSLFQGRRDVYPRRFESVKTGKSGYQPSCKNEWATGICNKPRTKCANCGNREYLPVTDQVIEWHLRGEKPEEYGNADFSIGVYPMLQDEKCWFLAADFDKSTWREDIQAYARTCAEMSVPIAVERSRSGNGGHVWMFFDEPIACMKARAIGSYILTETMERRPELGLDSYDRFFPNQDTLPQGGLGNLIALPLQKKPRENGNSVFLDESLEPCSDQWQYLSSIIRMGRGQIETLFQDACDRGRIVGLRIPITEEDDKPWESPPSGKKHKIVGPFPETLEIVLANQVFIPKDDLSPSLRNALIRLAAFQNPEFYQKQAMRMPTYNTPRVICCSEDFSKHIALPRGCIDDVAGLLKDLNIQATIQDKQFGGKKIDVKFDGQLYPEQQKAASAVSS